MEPVETPIQESSFGRVAAALKDPTMIGLFGVALLLRLWGIGYGLPQTPHPDEPFITDRAVTILKTGIMDPGWYRYPSFLIYLVTFLGWLLEDAGAPYAGFFSSLCLLFTVPPSRLPW